MLVQDGDEFVGQQREHPPYAAGHSCGHFVMVSSDAQQGQEVRRVGKESVLGVELEKHAPAVLLSQFLPALGEYVLDEASLLLVAVTDYGTEGAHDHQLTERGDRNFGPVRVDSAGAGSGCLVLDRKPIDE